MDIAALEQRLPARGKRLRILSPFDNLVIQRKRTAAYFDFDYLIECYVPASKRQYGYFCLPLLWRDTFVGRMDCKAHRQDGILEIKSLHLEASATPIAQWATAFCQAMENYLAFNATARLRLPKRIPTPLRKALAGLN